ncbi:MAG: hypothetical protein N3B18_05270 [Desulfobacterota bacterium]|nr:hypothetical protein [Thermodesulfobacteriota bacterium]
MAYHDEIPNGFANFERRIAELIRRNNDVPPAEVLHLLMRADAQPQLDVEQELERLRKKYGRHG